MDGDVTNSLVGLVATLAALAVGLVLGAADVKHETRGGVQAAVHKKKKTAQHTVVIFSQACEILESFETFSNLDKDIFGRGR